MILDPNNNSVIFTAGTFWTGTTYLMAISKSTNSGSTWERDTLTGSYYQTYALAVDASNSNIVYAGGYSGIYKSTDAGGTWFKSSTGLSGTIYDIVVSPAKGNTIYAGSSMGAYKSTDAGANWTNTGSGGVNAVLIHPTNPNEIYIGTSNGVYKSTTGGGGWVAMNDGLQSTNVTSLGIYLNNYLFCGTNGAGMYRWNIMVSAEETKTEHDLAVFSVTPNPSSGRVKISYHPETRAAIRISIYDAQGRIVRHLSPNDQSHWITWNGYDDKGEQVPNGIYFCRLTAGNETGIQKLLIAR